MKILKIAISIALFSGIISFSSCKKNDQATNISAAGDTESHNTGRNCMECHKSGGNGKGAFQAAGSVYDSTKTSTYSNVIVKLFTLENGGGTLRATINGDANGNFFTTEAIDFSGNLYPAVYGTSGNVKYMASSISSGACNSCHGSSTAKIWAK
jgi:mono/diheme cytochrome c family protein